MLAPLGLIIGPAAWAVSTQAGYAMASAACPSSAGLIIATGAALTLIAAAAAAFSFAQASRAIFDSETSAGARAAPFAFVTALSGLLSALTALVIVTQTSAALVIEGCAR
jgi:hypothetical protein